MLTGGADALVDLRLSGPRTDIFGMSRDDIRVQVDLSSISAAGTYLPRSRFFSFSPSSSCCGSSSLRRSCSNVSVIRCRLSIPPTATEIEPVSSLTSARMNERMNKILYLALSILLAIVLWLYVDDELGNTTQVPSPRNGTESPH